MDFGGVWPYLSSGIGAFGAGYGVWERVARVRADRRHAIQAAENRWILNARVGWFPEHATLILTCVDAVTSPVRVISIEVAEPKGTTICEGEVANSEGPPVVMEAGPWASRLELDRDLQGGVVWDFERQPTPTWVVLSLVAKPPRSTLGKRIRFRLALDVEEPSGRRARRGVEVASQEITLTAHDGGAAAR